MIGLEAQRLRDRRDRDRACGQIVNRRRGSRRPRSLPDRNGIRDRPFPISLRFCVAPFLFTPGAGLSARKLFRVDLLSLADKVRKGGFEVASEDVLHKINAVSAGIASPTEKNAEVRIDCKTI
ncbi:MAG: hypothetical protein AAF982_02585 [Pseudomonadota bacterium]